MGKRKFLERIKAPRLWAQTLLFLFLLSSCSTPSRAPETGELRSHDTDLPAAQTTFLVSSPLLPSSDAALGLLLLDEVTGAPYHAETVPMELQSDGMWKAEVFLTDGALIRYRYILVSPQREAEYSAEGRPVETRFTYIDGPTEVHDIVSAWPGKPHLDPTGRLSGSLLDAETGEPLFRQFVAAGGKLTLTDAEGGFRIDGLPAGLHHLTAFSPDGAYHPVQQDAFIAEMSLTLAEMELPPATPITVTFEVTLPEDTPANLEVRLAGNVQQLGHLYEEIEGGLRASVHSIPSMVFVDQEHRLFITRLYAGTYLRYKYTLGNGLWNAERTNAGFFNTRELLLPEEDVIIRDEVANWDSDSRQITFNVLTPTSTPLQDEIGLQFNPFQWLEPLPMTQISDHQWSLTLHGPIDFGSPLAYRYCRNLVCGGADDIDTAGPDAQGRSLTLSGDDPVLNDTVKAWAWWGLDETPTTIVAPDITPRVEFEAGIELIPASTPAWSEAVSKILPELSKIGVNSVVLSPSWRVDELNPLPVLQDNLGINPNPEQLSRLIQEAHALGMRVVLRPTLVFAQGAPARAWQTAIRDQDWWVTWGERYRAFAITQAALAQRTGADALILGDRTVLPSFPGGLLPDGNSAGTPLTATASWRELFSEIRAIFAGELGLEIELAHALQSPPDVLASLDRLHVYWHAPLSGGTEMEFAAMREAASAFLNQILAQTALMPDLSIHLSVEYLSIQGGADGCAEAPDLSCRAPEDFASGQIVDPDIQVDLEEQARAINAVLIEAYLRSEIDGFFVSGFNPMVALMDKSASIHGKPAQEVIEYWYSRLSGGP